MLVKKAIKLLSITILSLFFISNSFSIEPKDFVQQTVDKAAKALDQNLSKDLKISKLKIMIAHSLFKFILLYLLYHAFLYSC